MRVSRLPRTIKPLLMRRRFDLIGKNDDHPPIPSTMALGASDSNWVSGNAWLGMPMSIGVDLASVVDLVADQKDAERYGDVSRVVKEGFMDRGFALEGRIRSKDFEKEGGEPIGVVLGDLWKAVSAFFCEGDCADIA